MILVGITKIVLSTVKKTVSFAIKFLGLSWPVSTRTKAAEIEEMEMMEISHYCPTVSSTPAHHQRKTLKARRRITSSPVKKSLIEPDFCWTMELYIELTEDVDVDNQERELLTVLPELDFILFNKLDLSIPLA